MSSASAGHHSEILAALSQGIKEGGKKYAILTCEACTQSIFVPKFCTNCKGSAYCSTECQQVDWEQHSKRCRTRPTSTKRFMRDLYHNSVLMPILQAIFIAHFDLASGTRATGPKSGPLALGLTLAMIPSRWQGLTVYSNLPFRPPPMVLSPAGPNVFGHHKPAGIEVFLQMITFSFFDKDSFEDANEYFWARGQERGDSGSGDDSDPEVYKGLFMIRHDGALENEYDTIFPVPIHEKDLEAYRSDTLLAVTEFILGEAVPRPLTIKTLSKYFNEHVAADVENYFRLRTRLDVSKETLGQWGRETLRGLTRRDYTNKEALRSLRVRKPDGSKVVIQKKKKDAEDSSSVAM